MIPSLEEILDDYRKVLKYDSQGKEGLQQLREFTRLIALGERNPSPLPDDVLAVMSQITCVVCNHILNESENYNETRET